MAAIVAGVISLGVAHYQDQDSARQAVYGQEAPAAVQLETDANSVLQAVDALYVARAVCHGYLGHKPASCDGPETTSGYDNALIALDTERVNIADPTAGSLAVQFVALTGKAILAAGSLPGFTDISDMYIVYKRLITRCGQVIQGQAGG